VFKSTNGGGSWSAVNTGLTDTYGRALAIDPTTPATLYAGTEGGVFKSTDGGGNWSAVNTGLPLYTSFYTLAIDPTTPATLYAGTSGGGVFKSTNGGGSWSAVNTGLTATYVRALAIHPTTPATLYAGTEGGVFAIHQRLDAAGLAATITPSTVVLEWIYASNDADHYEVWRADNAPYFTPGDTCVAPGCASVTGTTHTDTAGCSGLDTNCTYVVQVVTTDDWRSTGARLGVFNFGLVPGQ